MSSDLEKITPPRELSAQEKAAVFEHFFHRLAQFRNKHEIYALTECSLSELATEVKERRKDQVITALNRWAQVLAEKAWVVCRQSEDGDAGECPVMDETADTSMVGLPPLPPEDMINKLFTTILFLHVTTAKEYSAYTRSFFAQFEPHIEPNEEAIVGALKNPERALSEAQSHAEEARSSHAESGRLMRTVGIGVGAIAGGVLIGVTGGLAAPLVGAGVTAVLGFLGVGGTAVGLLASGLAGSGLVCGALFGAYGAKSTAEMVQRHTREVKDLAVLPVKEKKGKETLGVRLCVSGWLAEEDDVCAPWTIFEGDDTYALQWEMNALKELSDALSKLITSQVTKYVRTEIIRRTALASLMSAMAPVAILNIGQIMDNPWMNARALAMKTGAVLGDLLAKRAFGNRPMTLVGYSLGSLVIFEALRYLSQLPVSECFGIIQDIFLFGTPVAADPRAWTKIRRIVAGRLVNGYASDDYVLAVLSRAANASWRVAGLGEVEVQGVENVHCKEVVGHMMWRGMIGKYLEECNAPGVVRSVIEAQVEVEEGEMTGLK